MPTAMVWTILHMFNIVHQLTYKYCKNTIHNTCISYMCSLIFFYPIWFFYQPVSSLIAIGTSHGLAGTGVGELLCIISIPPFQPFIVSVVVVGESEQLSQLRVYQCSIYFPLFQINIHILLWALLKICPPPLSPWKNDLSLLLNTRIL